jgi:hypothetical protein
LRQRWVRTGGAAVAAVALCVLQGTVSAGASVVAPAAATTGHDISWPQCGSTYPSDGSFGIVGVTDGRAWSANPCLTAEYQWAARYPRTPDLYMNTADPAPHSSYYWPASGAYDPVLCRDSTVTTDPGCAYDYGWHTAGDALATATSTLGSSALGFWWLDVETGNTWNGDAWSNAADVQGSIDYLMAQHAAGVGVYSTGYQWGAITGGYSTNNAAQYSAAWSSEFTSPNGIVGSPSWVAGASGPSTAPNYCGSSFLATATWLVQYIAGGFDVDHSCGGGGTPPPPTAYSIAVPSSSTAAVGQSVGSAVTLASTGGWSGTVALSVQAPSQVTATLSSASVVLSANSTATATLTLRSSKAGRYTVTVTARPAAGSSTSTTQTASTTFAVSRHYGGA